MDRYRLNRYRLKRHRLRRGIVLRGIVLRGIVLRGIVTPNPIFSPLEESYDWAWGRARYLISECGLINDYGHTVT